MTTDLMAFGGPAGKCFIEKVVWERPTATVSVAAGTARNTSTDQAAVYSALSASEGYAWKAMARKAKLAPEDVGRLGIGGFSAFHGFANLFLKNETDRARCDYVHLADACFLGAGATSPHMGYVAFAKEAVSGQKLMTVTTNGPWGKDIFYSYTYPEGDTVKFGLTSGAKCFSLVWNAAVGAPPESKQISIEVPGAPPATRCMRAGNLIWMHYETMTSGLANPCHGEYSAHGWHVSALSTPVMQAFGAPYMARGAAGVKTPAGVLASSQQGAASYVAAALGLGVGFALGSYLHRSMLRR